MIIQNITKEMNKVDLKEKFNIGKDLYLNELQLQERPAYYEQMMYQKFIEWFDTLMIESISKDYESYIITKSENEAIKLRKQYPESKVFCMVEIMPFDKQEKIKEYLKIKGYNTSLFRIIYRHIHNDKENFKILNDLITEEGYVIFDIKKDSESITSFKARHSEKNHTIGIDSIDEKFDKIYGLINAHSEYEKTGVLRKPSMQGTKNKHSISKETECEIILYRNFIKELDFFTLTRSIVYNSSIMHVYKTVEERKKDTDKASLAYIGAMTIEDAITVALEDTNVTEVLDVKKYIYPCWRIAIDHFSNQGMNYNLIEEASKSNGNKMILKIFV